jgi:hypothetical protein
MIKQVKGGWRLESHSGRNLGTFGSYSAAVKREKDILYFKHKRKDNS